MLDADVSAKRHRHRHMYLLYKQGRDFRSTADNAIQTNAASRFGIVASLAEGISGLGWAGLGWDGMGRDEMRGDGMNSITEHYLVRLLRCWCCSRLHLGR